VKTVITIHNLGYQGIFWHLDWHLLDLDESLFSPRHLEFYGMINFLKGGIVHADEITTVSPTYAEEIKTPEQGFRLDGVLSERAAHLTGILNGVDYRTWSPETDPFIAGNYGPSEVGRKQRCKSDLQTLLRLDEDPDVPVIGVVTRLSAQKGLDLLLAAAGELVQRGCQLAMVGSGDRTLQDAFALLEAQYPGRIGVEIAFSDTLAHKIVAGSDFILMPSRYEPGGLTQLYALKYGTIPIVRAVGGLKDTVSEFLPEQGEGTDLSSTRMTQTGSWEPSPVRWLPTNGADSNGRD